MSLLGDLSRLTRIVSTLERNGALEDVFDAFQASPRQRAVVRVLAWPFSKLGLGLKGPDALPPLARSLSALGPSYVKFGQLLSTRPDLTGEALSADLKELQENLPPFSDAEARALIEAELGAPIDTLFSRLDPPIAAASIAQVHPAVTRTGDRVAVKVLRPGVEKAFARDIAAFHVVARVIERLDSRTVRLKPTMVVRHFENVVRREMDLRLEAAAGSEYGDNIKNVSGFRTPTIYWDLTSRRVLTSGWVDGARLRDVAALQARGFDLPELARRLVQVFLRTSLRDGYFHADMHQGNLKLAPDGALVAFDFGIMGRIDPQTRRSYAEILYSYLMRDYRRGAQAHFDAGYVPADKDPELFAQALRSIGEPIIDRKAADIPMSRLLQQLFDVTAQFGMETREELLLLQRTMVAVEGVARSLDPDFDMWAAARPEVERYVAENLGPRAALSDLRAAGMTLARLGPRLPRLAERLAEMANGSAPPIAVRMAEPPQQRGGFWNGVLAGALGASLLLGAYLLGAAV